MKYVMLVAILVLVGCGRVNDPVYKEQVDFANRACANNGGIFTITSAPIEQEYRSCGLRCSEPTGEVTYRGTVQCANSATFVMKFKGSGFQ